MAEMIFTVPPQSGQVFMSIPNTRASSSAHDLQRGFDSGVAVDVGFSDTGILEQFPHR
jgi:hypothetical protein